MHEDKRRREKQDDLDHEQNIVFVFLGSLKQRISYKLEYGEQGENDERQQTRQIGFNFFLHGKPPPVP